MGTWSKCIVRSAASDGRTLEFEWRRMSDVMAGLIAGMSYMPESNAEDTCERVQYMGRLLRRGFELYCHPMPGVALRATALNQPGGTSIGYTAVSINEEDVLGIWPHHGLRECLLRVAALYWSHDRAANPPEDFEQFEFIGDPEAAEDVNHA